MGKYSDLVNAAGGLYDLGLAGAEPSTWMWCLECERVFLAVECVPAWLMEDVITGRRGMGDHEVLADAECPYCEAGYLDLWWWLKIVEANPGYPEVPKRGRSYALYS